MTLDKIKLYIKSLVGKSVRFKVNIGRNKVERYDGVIYKMYPSVFTAHINGIMKSFTYSDVLTKLVQIKEIIY